MTHRRYLTSLVVASLALGACSSSPSDPDPGASATSGADAQASTPAPATTTPPVGTVEPPSQIRGLGTLGLSKATMSVRVEPGLTNYDEHGLTYVEPRTDPAADLVVHHVHWDGTPGWDATVPVPSGEGTYTPRMSYDDAAGVVAYWFTTDTWDASDTGAGHRPHTLSSPVHWFDVATGQGEAVTVPTTEEQTASSHTTLVGARVLNAQGGFTAASTLDLTHTLSTARGPELFRGNDVTTVQTDFSWHGNYMTVTSTADDEAQRTLRMNTSAVLDADQDSRFWAVPERVLALVPGEGRLASVTETGAQDLDLGGCPVSFTQGATGGSGNGYAFVGQLLVRPDGTTQCLASQAAGPQEQVSGVLADGSVVLTNPADGGGATSRIMGPDGTTRADTTSVSGFGAYGAHLVFTTTDDAGATTVTAFSEKDLHLG